jgi:hypothetical protein
LARAGWAGGGARARAWTRREGRERGARAAGGVGVGAQRDGGHAPWLENGDRGEEGGFLYAAVVTGERASAVLVVSPWTFSRSRSHFFAAE